MSTEAEAIVAAIRAMADTLSARIESTENDFIGHLKKVDDKLDLVVDLTKTVAVLQHQHSQYGDHLAQLREQLKENQAKSDASITRLHARIDELNTNLRDRVDLAQRESDLTIKGVKQEYSSFKEQMFSYVNWGKGAYAIGALFSIFFIWSGGRWLDDLEKSRTALTNDVAMLKRESTAIDARTYEINSRLQDHINGQKPR